MYKPFSWGTAPKMHNYLNIYLIGNKNHMEENSSTACIEGPLYFLCEA